MAQLITLTPPAHTHAKLDPSASKPLIGNDILRRITQLEGKSRSSAAVASSEAGLVPVLGSTRASMASKPRAVARSATAPELSLNTAAAAQKSSPSTTEEDPRPSSPESVCHSPTWEARKRRREKKSKENRDKNKRENKEAEGEKHDQGTSRARKRLSKRPPAAMETQGYATAAGPLRPGSRETSSRRSSLSESKEAKRSSISSFSSTLKFPDLLYKKSSSLPPAPLETPLALAQDIGPRQRSREGSKVSFATRMSTDDEAYVTDLVDFACEMGRSMQKALDNDVAPVKTAQRRSAALSDPRDSAVSFKTGRTIGTPTKLTFETQRGQSQNAGIQQQPSGKRDNAAGGYRYPNFKKLLRKEKARTIDSAPPPSSDRIPRNLQDIRSHSAPAVHTLKSLKSHCGYVQQHRLSLQHRSVARLEDELAVKEATEALYLPQAQPERESSEAGKEPITTTKEPWAASPHDVDIATTKANSNETLQKQHGESIVAGAERNVTAKSVKRALSSFSSGITRHDQRVRPGNTHPGAGTSSASKLPSLQRVSTSPILPTFKSEELTASAEGNVEICIPLMGRSQPGSGEGPSHEARNSAKDVPTEIRQGDLARAASLKRSKSDADLEQPAGPPPKDALANLNPQGLSKPALAPRPISALPAPIDRKKPSRLSFLPTHDQLRAKRHSLGLLPKPTTSITPSQQTLAPAHAFGPRGLAKTSTTTPAPPSVPTAFAGKASIAKMFVICCGCQRWHDLPASFYEAMALPKKVVTGGSVGVTQDGACGGLVGNGGSGLETSGRGGVEMSGGGEGGNGSSVRQSVGMVGRIYTAVKCPWCEHEMSTGCCAGWTAVVGLRERHH